MRAGPQSGLEATGGWKEVSIPLFPGESRGRKISVKIGTLCLLRPPATRLAEIKVALFPFPATPKHVSCRSATPEL